MAEHTEGPWIVGPAQELPLAVIEDAKNGTGVCEIQSPGERASNACERDRAIARLIVAAPDLLEACESLIEEIESIEYQPALQVVFDKVRAAINNAR